MRFGLVLPSYSFPDLDYDKAGRLRDFCTRAEALGYESLWAVEHLLTARGLYGTAWLSPLETLSFAAGCTTRIRLATGILIAALRNPVFLAKEIASLQFLSGGRFELGVGVGWDAQEYAVAGVPLRERGRRTDEILGIFEKLWTGAPVTHHGRYYHFDEVQIDLPLPQRPRLWVAGGSKLKTALSPDPENIAPSVLERICRHADGWLARAAGSPESVVADWAQIRRRLAELGPAREQRDLRPYQFRPHRADRRRGRGAAGAAAVDRADYGDAPLLRASADLLSARHPAADSGAHRRIGRSRSRISRVVAARLRSRSARSVAGRNHRPFPPGLRGPRSQRWLPISRSRSRRSPGG